MTQVTIGEKRENILKSLLDGMNKGKIEIVYPQKYLPASFSSIMSFIYELLDNEGKADISLKDFPFCVVAPNARDHIVVSKKSGEKTTDCQKCFFNKECGGFPAGYLSKFGHKEVVAIADRPIELMLEVESRCNLSCHFCFNKNAFFEEKRKNNNITLGHLKEVIKNAADFGVGIIRFTGGEPLLKGDISKLFAFAKKLGLEVRLNTNAQLVTKELLKKINGLVDNILIPLEASNDKQEALITGKKDSFTKKIEAIKLIKEKQPNLFLRIGTVASRSAINDFEIIDKLNRSLGISEWEWYRPVSLKQDKKTNINKSKLQELINKIYLARNDYWGDKLFLANAIPFCAFKDPKIVNSISVGGLFDDGHTRLVLDPRGFFKPHYFMDKKIGSSYDVEEAWNHPFMKKMRHFGYLPKMCQKCFYKSKCRGGSRYEANNFYGDISSPDPLIINK